MKISLKINTSDHFGLNANKPIFYQKTKKRTHSLFGKIIEVYTPYSLAFDHPGMMGKYLISPWYEETFSQLPLIAIFYC